MTYSSYNWLQSVVDGIFICSNQEMTFEEKTIRQETKLNWFDGTGQEKDGFSP